MFPPGYIIHSTYGPIVIHPLGHVMYDSILMVPINQRRIKRQGQSKMKLSEITHKLETAKIQQK